VVTEALISMMVGVVNGFLSLVPAWAPNTSALTNSGTNIGAWAMAWNGYFPVAVLAACLLLVLAVKLALLGFRTLVWVYHQFWGSD